MQLVVDRTVNKTHENLMKPLAEILWYLVRTGISFPPKFYYCNMHLFKKVTIKCTFSLNILTIRSVLQVYIQQMMQKHIFMVCLTAEGGVCHWLGSLVYVSPYCNLHTWTGQRKKPEELQFLVDNISRRLR